MHAFHTRVFFVFHCMASKHMCFTCVFASVKTGFAFSLVLSHSSCISNACLHRLRRLLRFPSYVSVSQACLHRLRRLFRFLRFPSYVSVSQACLHRLRRLFRLLRFPSYVSVSQACLHRLRRLFRFPWYGVTMYAFHKRVCIS